MFTSFVTFVGAFLMAMSFTRLDQIEAKATEWVWFPYLARGKVTLLEGDPGVGKSTVALDFVARLSRGAAMPGEKNASRRAMRTLILDADHDASVNRERLLIAGADLSCVFVSNEPRRLNDFQDVCELEDLIEGQDIDLLVIDSLPAFLGKIKWRDEAQIRAALKPLIEMAQKQKIAVLILMPSLAGRGRLVGMCGAFSIALEVVDHPRMVGSVLLFMRRTTLGPKRDPIAGRLFEPGDDELAKWSDLLDGEISKPLGPMTGPGANVVTPEMIALAAAWLAAFMAGRTMMERVIYAAGEAAGFRKSLLGLAKQELGYPGEAEIIKGQREWVWVAVQRAK